MDVAPQAGHRQGLRLQHHGAEQLRVQLHIPALARAVDHGGGLLLQLGRDHIFQLPVITLKQRATGETGRQQIALGIELVARHPEQHAIGLHGVDMDELITLTVPQAALGALRLTSALGHGPIGLGQVLTPGRQVFADQYTRQHDHQHRLHHRPDDPANGHPGGAHDGQLAAAGQIAQADQAADQRRHRQHFIDPPRNGQQHPDAGVEQAVGGTDIAQFVDIGEQQRQADDDAQHRQNGEEHAGANVAIELNHGSPPARRGGKPI